MKYVIIGSSAAGLSGLEAIKENKPEADLTVITADNFPPHSRILTSYLLGGQIPEDNIFIRSKSYFQDMGVRVLAEERVTKLNSENKFLELASGKKVEFDRLLIASGASTRLPGYRGNNLKGVFTLRDLRDVNTITDYLSKRGVEHCILLGGGLVSLKVAEAFHRRGLKVSLIIRSPQILSQMLDKGAAALIEDRLVKKGFQIYKGESIDKINGFFKASGVKLESGKTLNGDLVFIGKGVKPNTGFLDDNIRLGYEGILVDEYMETTVPDIYAAGDVTVTWDFLTEARIYHAIWPDAVWQGRIAGRNMLGHKVEYEGSLNLNALKIFDTVFFTIGKVRFLPGEEEEYSIYLKDISEQGIYRKLVFKDGVLVGVIAIGQTEDIGLLYTLIKKRISIEDRAEEILNHGLDYAQLVKDKFFLKESRVEL